LLVLSGESKGSGASGRRACFTRTLRGCAAVLALSALLLVPVGHAAAVPGYRYEQSFMQPYLAGTTLTLASGNPGTGVSAQGAGFPVGFEFTFYGERRGGIFSGPSVTDQGFLNWGGTFVDQIRSCLPAGFPDKVMAPYWSQELAIDRTTHPDDGVYTGLSGVAPNRQWVADWRVHRGTEPRRFGVILNESSGIISFQYTGTGFPAGSDAAVGTQEAGTTGKFTQYSCGSVSLVSGQRIDFIPDPRNLSPPAISGQAVQGNTVGGSTGTWDGTTPIDFAYGWLRCDPDGGNCLPIDGADQLTYTVAAADVNHTLRFRVIATSQKGDDFAESAPTEVVATAASGGASAAPVGAPTTPPAATCKDIPATIVGTEGNDVRSGTPGKDVIVGLGGNDKLSGLAGNDVICGGSGKDTLKGGKGNDKLYGESGKDTLKGGPGKDKLKGGPGKDKQVQ
jgi:RTX calcium-binding nonapeptide repeat (4 copies)